MRCIQCSLVVAIVVVVAGADFSGQWVRTPREKFEWMSRTQNSWSLKCVLSLKSQSVIHWKCVYDVKILLSFLFTTLGTVGLR